MSAGDVFWKLTKAFERAGIAYMLSGSFASAYYGASRSTQDIDFVIEATPAQLETFIKELPREEYYVELPAALEAHRQQSLFNMIDLESGWKIDLIIRKARAFSREEFDRRRRIDLQGVGIFIASPEDIILAKLEWSKLSQSQRQIEDVATILRARWESLDRAYIKEWLEGLQLGTEWNLALTKAGLTE
jgi:hypothetical protein